MREVDSSANHREDFGGNLQGPIWSDLFVSLRGGLGAGAQIPMKRWLIQHSDSGQNTISGDIVDTCVSIYFYKTLLCTCFIPESQCRKTSPRLVRINLICPFQSYSDGQLNLEQLGLYHAYTPALSG